MSLNEFEFIEAFWIETDQYKKYSSSSDSALEVPESSEVVKSESTWSSSWIVSLKGSDGGFMNLKTSADNNLNDFLGICRQLETRSLISKNLWKTSQ